MTATASATTTTTTSSQPTDLQQRYEQEGYVVARGVIDRELVEEGRAHVAWLMRRHPDLRPENLGHTLLEHDPFWIRLISDDRLLDVAQQFIGQDIALFASHYIAKPPRDGQPVLWHQDGSYWPLEPMSVVTLWLALDDSDAGNGCMRVIPRTHTTSLQQMKPRHDIVNVLASGMDESLVDESQARDLVLSAGDVSIHHPNIIHGSNANRSERWRRGLTIRYIPTSTRITAMPFPSAFLLRGTARDGINQYKQRPRFNPEEHLHFRGCERWNDAR